MIKVLIIDDSALIRDLLRKIFSKDSEIQVVGTANDPISAIKKIRETKPDVITLDIEMPKMDGLTFLRKLMSVYPTPVVIISSRAQMGSDVAIKAIRLGAVSVVAKPTISISEGINRIHQNIINAVKDAAKVNMRNLREQARKTVMNERRKNENIRTSSTIHSPIQGSEQIVAIGASTGGTVAVRNILKKIPANFPSIFVILHMPAGFTKSFADGLDRDCMIRVKEIEDQELVRKGYAYIAPGAKHTTIKKGEYGYYFSLDDEPPVNRFKPSIDKAFFSVAETVGENAIGVILTGMGRDGAEGLKAMKENGAYTMAQDEKTSVIYGMPKRAAEIGAVHEILPIDKMADAIIKRVNKV